MDFETRNIVKMVALALFYVLVGTLHLYSGTTIFFFPFLAAPLSIWFMSRRRIDKMDALLHIVIVVSIYFTSGSITNTILYLIVAVVPGYYMGYLYKKRIPLIKIALYTGISVIGVFYAYVVLIGYAGIDYVGMYLEAVALYEAMVKEMLTELASSMGDSMGTQLSQMFEVAAMQVSILAKIYPALFLVIGIILGILQTIIVNVIGKIRKWGMPSLKDLVRFRLSKLSILLYIISVLGLVSEGMSPLLQGAILNLSFFIQALFQGMGVIALIALIRRSKTNGVMKVLLVFLTLMIINISPTTVSIFGLLDTAFNHRKVEVVV